jgi:hypothetical protein
MYWKFKNGLKVNPDILSLILILGAPDSVVLISSLSNRNW